MVNLNLWQSSDQLGGMAVVEFGELRRGNAILQPTQQLTVNMSVGSQSRLRG
jgi:hypothetical protein